MVFNSKNTWKTIKFHWKLRSLYLPSAIQWQRKTQSWNERVKIFDEKKLLSNMVWTESSVEMLITDIIIMKHQFKKS